MYHQNQTFWRRLVGWVHPATHRDVEVAFVLREAVRLGWRVRAGHSKWEHISCEIICPASSAERCRGWIDAVPRNPEAYARRMRREFSGCPHVAPGLGLSDAKLLRRPGSVDVRRERGGYRSGSLFGFHLGLEGLRDVEEFANTLYGADHDAVVMVRCGQNIGVGIDREGHSLRRAGLSAVASVRKADPEVRIPIMESDSGMNLGSPDRQSPRD